MRTLSADQMQILDDLIHQVIEQGFGQVTIHVWRGDVDRIDMVLSYKVRPYGANRKGNSECPIEDG